MRSNIQTVMKKELARFFGDKRMVLMLLLPGILIYVVYTFMGSAFSNMFSPDQAYIPTACTVNIPDVIAQRAALSGISIQQIDASEVETVKEKLAMKEADLCVVFPKDFEKLVDAYDVKTATGPAPNVEVYYNSIEPNSQNAYMIMISVLDTYESSLANKFDVNRGVTDIDQAADEDKSASIISSMMPMLLMVFLCSGCMGLAPDAIAGEKERGTIATLLVTPLKRSQLATGKILSLAVLSFLSGLVTAAATILSLPKLMSGAEDMIDAGIYSAVDYLLLAFVILSTILLLVAVFSIISAFAKTVKEASAAVMPLMIIVLLVGVTGMFGGGTQASASIYLIPLYSSVQCMSGIFSLSYSSMNILISCLSSLIYALIGGYILTRMFNSEKVMFSR